MLVTYETSLNKANINVKTVCEKSGIDIPFIKEEFKGNKFKEIKMPKYKAVTTHIGRRSFACNSYKAGVPHHIIMKVGGWESQASFKKYLHLSSTDGLQDDSFNFFNKPIGKS